MADSMMTRFPQIMLIALALLHSNAVFAEDWICTEAASIKEGNSILVCGVASADNEGDAREQALIRAKREFQLLCDASADCRGRPTNVEPLRNSCNPTPEGGYKCYRGLSYTFSDGDSGVFGRSAAVAQVGLGRPDVIKPFNFGVAYYNAIYRATRKDALPNAPSVRDDTFSGVALFFTAAFSHRYGIDINGYWQNNTARTRQSKQGIDGHFIVGTHLNQRGFKAYFGVGAFGEKWRNALDNTTFSGAEAVFGVGYNTRGSTLDLTVAVRQTKPYDDLFFNGNVAALNTTAGGAMFRYGLRF